MALSTSPFPPVHRQAERSRVRGSLLHYDNGVKKEKWTRNELLSVAGCVFGLFCIWAFFQVRGCAADDTRIELSRLRHQAADLQTKNAALTEQLTDTRKQLQESTDRVFELTAVAGRAPAMPIKVKSWRDRVRRDPSPWKTSRTRTCRSTLP